MDAKTKKRYEGVKESLISDLETRGLVEDVYTDKVEEYMALWETFNELKKDIKKRGATVMDEKRGMAVENRSISLALQTSKQMLEILGALGFRENACGTANRRGRESEADDEL